MPENLVLNSRIEVENLGLYSNNNLPRNEDSTELSDFKMLCNTILMKYSFSFNLPWNENSVATFMKTQQSILL